MRNRVKRALAVAPVLVALAAGAVACGGNESGHAQPQPGGSWAARGLGGDGVAPPASSGATGGSGNGPLANTDPCSLLPARYLGQLGVGQGRTGQVDPGVSRACDFDGQGYGASVAIFDTLGMDRPNVQRQTTPTTINGGAHRAVQDTAGGVCAIILEVTESSSVDVVGSVRGGDQNRSCQLAKLVAQAVEPQLPKS